MREEMGATYLQIRKCIAGDTKGRVLDVVGEGIEPAQRHKLNKPRRMMKTYWSEYRRILAIGSCFNISLNINPVLSATSSVSYLHRVDK